VDRVPLWGTFTLRIYRSASPRSMQVASGRAWESQAGTALQLAAGQDCLSYNEYICMNKRIYMIHRTIPKDPSGSLKAARAGLP
jgi:hypothetical protein